MNNGKRIYFLFFLSFFFPLLGDALTLHRYFWASYNHFSHNFVTAHHWYKKLIPSSYSSHSYKGYLHLLFDTHQYKNIVELIPSLDKKFEKDPEIQLIFALSLEKCQNINAADAKLIKMSSMHKNNSEITLRTTQAYLRRKEPENALSTIDAFLNNSPRKPHNFIFYFLKSQIHLQLGKLTDALNNITICLDMHPRFDKGWLLCATLQEQQGEIKKALQGYTTFLELSPENDPVEKHLFSLMLTHKTDEYAPFHRSYFDQASSYFNKKKYHAALKYINQYLELQPHNDEAFMLKMHILAIMNEHKKIITLVSQKINDNPASKQLWTKSIYLLHHHGIEKERIIALLTTLSNAHPDNQWSFLYAADLCIRTRQYEQATMLLQKASTLSDNTQLASKIYHQLSVLYYELENYQDMITYLEKAYECDAQSDHLNNTLAYYWATKGKNLQKASYFFDKIDKKKDTNPYFLDTQALIFYKQQEYQKAQKILESIPHDQHNATTLLHLAKVYYKLNNKEKALATSKQAINYANSNKEKKDLHKLQTSLTTNG